MKTEILELEKILNEEIEAYSTLEKYIIEKKDNLIQGNIEKLKYTDNELEKYSAIVEKLETKRAKVSSKFGNERMSLREIIDNIEDNRQAERISSTRDKLQNIAGNIQRHNNINAQLIAHSLKLIEHSVVSIANILVPESSAYNNSGKIKCTQAETISSVVHEA